MVSNPTLSFRWKCFGFLGFAGAGASAAASKLYPGRTGDNIHNAYLFDDLLMEQLLFSASIALLFISVYRTREFPYDAMAPKHNSLVLCLSRGTAALFLTAALYAFDIAFFDNFFFHKQHTTDYPGGQWGKELFCTLYSCIGAMGLALLKHEQKHKEMSSVDLRARMCTETTVKKWHWLGRCIDASIILAARCIDTVSKQSMRR